MSTLLPAIYIFNASTITIPMTKNLKFIQNHKTLNRQHNLRKNKPRDISKYINPDFNICYNQPSVSVDAKTADEED